MDKLLYNALKSLENPSNEVKAAISAYERVRELKEEARKYGTLDARLSWLIYEGRAMQQNFKSEIEDNDKIFEGLDAGLEWLENALSEINLYADFDGNDSLEKHQSEESRQSRYV